MPLPFLIAHGAKLWKLVLVGLALLCIGVVFLLRRLDARRSARNATKSIESEGELVRGTLGGGSITTLILDRDRAVNRRDPELWIETSDGRVPLVGDDIRALSGSRMSQKRNGAPKRTPKSMFDDPAVHHPRLRARTIKIASLFELAPGDRVIARGTLVREPGTQATDYRESVTTLSLHGPIKIGAVTPRGVAARPSVIALALVAGITALIGYKIEAGLGESWRHECFDLDHLDDHGPRPFELSNTHPCVLANTMPDQPYVLDQLVDQFARSPIKSDAELGQHLELARTVGGCTSSLELLETLAQPDALLAESVRCGDRKHQQIALTELGRFDEAAKLGPLEHRTGALYILGREWTEAAKLAERYAFAADEKPSPDDARQWRCLAELMRYYGGDQGALARVQKLAPGDDSPCRAELAEMTLDADRDRLMLLGASKEATSRAHRALSVEESTALSIEQVLSGRPALRQENVGTYLARGSSELSMVSGVGLWAVAVAPEPHADVTEPLFEAGEGQFAYYAARIISRVHDGDLVGAHHDADRAIAIAKPMYEYAIYSRKELAILHALIDLYGPTTTTPYEPAPTDASMDAELQNYLMPHILLRHGQPVQQKQWIGGDLPPLEAAARGDATKLVEGLTGQYSNWAQLDVLSVLPRVTTKRAELVAAMRWGSNRNERMIGYDFPWCSIAYAAERRTLFDLGGDHDEAARWAAIYARYRKALTDRKSLVALALWNQP